MKAAVTVYRDAFAVPHVYAENEEDLYRAMGFLMAQDRLWQMDLMRRATTGRLAEIFGDGLIKTDLLMRALRMTEKSKLILSKTDPEIIKMLEAFADGINQYIEGNRDKLPPEFIILGYEPEKWQPLHSVNLVGYMAWDLTSAWGVEVLLHKIAQKVEPAKFKELIPGIRSHEPAVHTDFSQSSGSPGIFGGPDTDLKAGLLDGSFKLEELGLGIFNGSNNWAVSDKRSVTGKPILANDMHLGLFVPGTWYQVHQVVEGKLNVTGVAVPGQPFIVAGHNDRIAWGMTNVMVDDMDFYRETINGENPNQYKFNGEWKDLEIKIERIKTKDGKIIEKKLAFTHRGPVISQFKAVKEAISIRWIGNEYSNELRTIYLLNRAKNWDQFRDAVKTFIAVSQNIVYADVDGNIAMQTCAGVPIRKGDGIHVVPGETDEYDWTGIVPFEELPYSLNPECGHVSSANNKTVNDNYPYHISHWFVPPDRAARILEMLEEKEKLSMEDMKRMHGDFKSKHVERYLGDITAIVGKSTGLNDLEKKALELLARWDGRFTMESPAATVFEKMYMVLVKNLVKDEMGEYLYNRYMGNKILIRNLVNNIWRTKASEWCDNTGTEKKETFNDWILSSFKETVAQLRADLGDNPDNWQWGKMHTLVLKHPVGGNVRILDMLFNFNRGPFYVGGSYHTVCPYSYSFRNPYVSNFGASQRHIYSTGDWDTSQTVIPTGTSGIPASPHYCDQTTLYLENKYHNDFVGMRLVEENARYKMVISNK
ncbi:MAG: penicillin acylase family protein [bacterium]|nr:penicillin acylase family protein [bacterium]